MVKSYDESVKMYLNPIFSHIRNFPYIPLVIRGFGSGKSNVLLKVNLKKTEFIKIIDKVY